MNRNICFKYVPCSPLGRMVRSRKFIQAAFLIFVGFSFTLLFIAYFLTVHKYLDVSQWRCENEGATLQIHDGKLLCLGHRNIFFVETSNTGHLNSRQACAVESAARHNPSYAVTVLMTSTTDIVQNDLMRDLKHVYNVRILRIDYEVVVFGTPLWNWYRWGRWRKSDFKICHLSDALRLLLVWKYGGVYLDLDVVVLRSLDNLTNCTVSDNGINSSNSFLFFSRGHPLLKKCIADFAATYDHKGFAVNGPLLLTRNIKDLCGVGDLFGTRKTTCGVQVLPTEVSFPIPYERWEEYFIPMVNGSGDLSSSYLIHVWNKMSSGRKLTIGGGSLYEWAMKENCPITYKNAQRLGYL